MIDLRSDTVTRPTQAMRRAMAEAEVGDDVLDGDPTVRRLEATLAELLGHERGLFFPTGTMANQAAIALHTRPGTEILVDGDAHVIHWEMAGAAALSGVQVRPVVSPGAVMDAASLRAAMRPLSPHAPIATLVCAENTHNGAGGMVTPLEALREIAAVAREAGLPLHLDGARLWNASAATGLPIADLARCADTVMVSFSKGLGAPVGAALVGSRAIIEAGWSVRKRLGGGMRQSGILAAAALHGIEHHRARLGEDHANARLLAELVNGAGGATVVPPDTNILMVDLPPGIEAGDVVAGVLARNVRITPWNRSRVRAVTHLDVDAEQVRTAGGVIAETLSKLAERSSRAAD
jgi:threonine aldolase